VGGAKLFAEVVVRDGTQTLQVRTKKKIKSEKLKIIL